jgi:hypothetical protein
MQLLLAQQLKSLLAPLENQISLMMRRLDRLELHMDLPPLSETDPDDTD